MRNPNLIDKFISNLSPPARDLLDHLLHLAEARDTPAYLVGGPLRDLLLDRPVLDIDIAVEGDAIALACDLVDDASRRDASARRLGAAGGASDIRIKTHPSFLTATVRLPGVHLDLITARSETYARPGALPTVTPVTIHEDLLRRDFTINALALRLNGPDRGEVFDPAGGLADLDTRLIRDLHERSFQDDATRILRAFRYAARLGFEIEPQTLVWLKRDLPYLDAITSARLHHEFSRILAERGPEEALLALHDIGALAAIHPALRFEREQAEAFARLRYVYPTGARAAYWPVFARDVTPADVAGIARRLALTRTQRAALQAVPQLADITSRRDAPAGRLGMGGGATLRDPYLNRSEIADLFAPFPLPALWALTALTGDPTNHNRLLDYLTKARYVRPHLTGDDLLALGVPSGPHLGEILRLLRNARLDGEVTSREDEKRLARELIVEGDNAARHTKNTARSRSS